MLLDNAVELVESCLSAGCQAVSDSADHDVLHEHPVIEHTAPPHDSVYRKDQPDRSVKEAEILGMLRFHGCLVVFAQT